MSSVQDLAGVLSCIGLLLTGIFVASALVFVYWLAGCALAWLRELSASIRESHRKEVK